MRDIAPDNLLDRDAELDELVEFCAGDQPYVWWQAGPWAGKSALMAWFVLHPPTGVDVVSFFITARLAGQSDSDACTDALIEQLAALIGESPASLLTAGARRGTMLRLLDDAARRSREAGRRLLLVIDGLDEDSGTTGPDQCSIVALLPRRPPPDVRVLVASRPHPLIPDDVADQHPLRTITPRQLVVSEHARGVERSAKHELTQLLAGSQLQREVLGLITAAGGGLTLGDLEELTAQPPYEIGRLLGGLFGRSVGSRIGTPSAGYPDERVYLFTHETLRLVAEQQYGSSLAAYRDRLHTWADSYRQRSWSTDTPPYLLRSYPRMLASNGDLTRLVACATDQARHDRMRDLTGGDALAFTEISTAQQLILAQPDPDLTSLALLAVQREHLTDRNSNIPAELPVVWAKLGQSTRAEALANSIPDPYLRAWALSRLVEVAAETGDRDRAAQLVCEAEALAVQIADPSPRAQVLGRLAVVVAKGGDRNRAVRLTDEAEALTPRITRSFERASVLGQLTEAVAACGDQERCKAFMSQISDRSTRARVLGRLAAVLTRNGDRDRAVRLAVEAEMLVPPITDPDLRAEALSEFTEIWAEGGDRAWAPWLACEVEALTAQVFDPYQRADELSRLADAVAEGGDWDRAVRLVIEAQALTTQITHPGRRAETLVRLAEVVAAGDDYGWATRLVSEAESLAAQLTDPDWWAPMLNRLVGVVAICGDYSRAEVLIALITDPGDRAGELGRLAEVVLAEGGDHDRAARLVSEAEALTAQLTDPYERALALSQLADAVFTSGDEDQAVRLASEAEALAARFTDPRLQAPVFGRLAELAAAGRDYDQAEALIAQIVEPGARAGALGPLAKAVETDGDHDLAARLVSEAEVLTGRISNRYQQAEALASLAVTLRTTTENTTPVREDPYGSSPELVRSRSLLAEALAIGSWSTIVFDLALIDPSAVSALADELEVRWKLDGPRDGRER